jgi:predicted ATPase
LAIRRIAVTGGPGAGKTTLWRELSLAHTEQLVPVPEVATMMFRHVFPRVQSETERRSVQRAIFHVQCELERVYEGRTGAGQILLCDRGTADGAGYWPEGPAAFFAELETAREHELGRYEAVLFLESAAAGGLPIHEGNAIRTEDLATAVSIDRRLHEVWSTHPNFLYVPHARRFADKLAAAATLFLQWLERSEEPA